LRGGLQTTAPAGKKMMGRPCRRTTHPRGLI
jgi:hypothetical protein